MRRVQGIAAAAAGVCAASVLVGASASGAEGLLTTNAELSSSKYQVCNFDDPSIPKANKKYPFSFLLSTQWAGTSRRDVRKAVRSIQAVLRAEGFTGLTGSPIRVDGSYGPHTAHAVKQFQRKVGIVVDGKVGQQTWRRLGGKYCWKYH